MDPDDERGVGRVLGQVKIQLLAVVAVGHIGEFAQDPAIDLPGLGGIAHLPPHFRRRCDPRAVGCSTGFRLGIGGHGWTRQQDRAQEENAKTLHGYL